MELCEQHGSSGYELELSKKMTSETANYMELSIQLISDAGPLVGIVKKVDFGCRLLVGIV